MESSLGWSGERGEDSSYDSECEDESVHRAASRTPSDTLAAEFAEYVTLTPPLQPNQVNTSSKSSVINSCYGSKCEDEGAHRAAPRTPSGALDAEEIITAEYITYISSSVLCMSPSLAHLPSTIRPTMPELN